ncbi:uncharacterized protein LOC129222952 [Uloborus diversus]|uniref:uncharacterized protein LOC129222952 n=1 Tax=Uloborus diversus TaxID=327109 RepID=UPI00240A67F2|nr:uncharacterized protein LOC129222952 [Uloborus diversus]
MEKSLQEQGGGNVSVPSTGVGIFLFTHCVFEIGVRIDQMLFSRELEHVLGKEFCASYTTLPSGRRMSTQSLVCEASSLYPSVPRRQGSLCHLDKLSFEACIAQLSELRDTRLPPPSRSTGQGRRRMSLASSQGSRAANAGSGHEYLSDRGSRCRSSLGHYGLEPELWIPRRGSMTHSELLNEVNLSPSSSNTRQRVWSEAGRSCDETTIRASLKNHRSGSVYLVPGSRRPSTRRASRDEHISAEHEDLMDLSYSDSLMPDPNYEKLPTSKREKRRNSRDYRSYHCYDNPTSLDEFHEI